MDALILKVRKGYEDISASVVIERDGQEVRALGELYGLSLKDVEWLILANTSEHTTPWMVEIEGEL